MKKYLLTYISQTVEPSVEESNLEEALFQIMDVIKLTKFLPVTLNTPNKVVHTISEETFKVLESICNVEIDCYGRKEYICNKLRMTIEEIENDKTN